MQWSEEPSSSAPMIKNHSVTFFNNYLYTFGGYNGRHNHNTLMMYSIADKKWIRPLHIGADGGGGNPNNIAYRNNNNNPNDSTIVVHGTPPPGRNGHTATLATDPDDEEGVERAKIIVIGGWLGSGPLAANVSTLL